MNTIKAVKIRNYLPFGESYKIQDFLEGIKNYANQITPSSARKLQRVDILCGAFQEAISTLETEIKDSENGVKVPLTIIKKQLPAYITSLKERFPLIAGATEVCTNGHQLTKNPGYKAHNLVFMQYAEK